MEWEFPPAWKKLAEEISSQDWRIMLVGGVDCGKTTYAQYILKILLEKKEEVAYINADVGQAILGPPATLSMSFLKRFPSQLETVLPDYQWFIGSNSPSGFFTEVILGVHSLVQVLEEKGNPPAVMDTSGLIKGEEGKRLKYMKSLVFQPDLVVILEREDEMEEIYSLLLNGGFRVEKLRVGDFVKVKTRQDRINFRREKFKRYFEGSEVNEFSLKGLGFVSHTKVIQRGQLVGLLEEKGFLLGLGLWMGVENGKVKIFTPLKNFDDLKIIWVGRLIIDPETGEEK
ncbi:MAG TPA: hypothetical protein ENG13_02565 [bacterium]|nr:hypothetical protein [bacterium]HEX67930.1 hypothetical protein [bacterium]